MFIALVELQPTDGSPLDPGQVAGAYVRCYVPETSREMALQIVRRSLEEDHFLVVNVEFCESEDSEWEAKDDGSDEAGLQEARATGRVAYGTFHAWGHDAPDE